jgi:IclR family acetate operon transcriptional repressor
LRPVQCALEVLDAIGSEQPVGVSAIARKLSLPKTTAHRVLQSLHAAGWIEQDRDDSAQWCLTIKAGLAVGQVHHATMRLRSTAFPIMEELRARTKESIYIAVRSDFSMALVERLDGLQPVVHAWPLWQRGPLHASSLGKSMLAELGPDDLDAYLLQDHKRHTNFTQIDPAIIRAEVNRTRERGFATSFRENWPNENGVGAAIRDEKGEANAAISISAPCDRVGEEQCLAWGEMIGTAAQQISLGMARAPY